MKIFLKVSLFLVLIFSWGCGSNSSQPSQETPLEDVSPFVSKSVILEPVWPADLAGLSSQLQLTATLKGETGQVKSVGSIGPVVGKSESGKYHFEFAEIPKELGDSGDVVIRLFLLDPTIPQNCQQVGRLSKMLSFSNGHAIFAADSNSFDLSDDCDGDHLTNIREWRLGLKLDEKDSDDDSVSDDLDFFPLNPEESKDSDLDGVGDFGDNCPNVSNEKQADLDQDGVGDECDADIDNDGLSNEVETDLGLNPQLVDSDGDSASDENDLWPKDGSRYSDLDEDGIADDHLQDNCPTISNIDQHDLDNDTIGDACDNDVDGDGVADIQDNCPLLSNATQFDTDGDKTGDLCDCKPQEALVFSSNVDEPDNAGFDSNCDGVDGDKTKAVFVDALAGRDQNGGSLEEPLKTISAAVLKAVTENKDIYIAKGSYDLNGVSFTKGLRFYGGYAAQGHASRDVSLDQSSQKTEFTNTRADTVLHLFNIEGEFLFDGIYFVGSKPESDEVLGARTIVIENSRAQITNSRIDGSNLGNNTTALAVLTNSAVILDQTKMDGGSGLNTSRGIFVESSDDVVIQNSVIHCGAGRFCVGIEVKGASPLIQNNTIDASSRTTFSPDVVTTKAVSFENALSLSLVKNILATENADNRYPLYCSGLEPIYPEKIDSNVLISNHVWAVSCLGGFDLVIDDGLTLGLRTAINNSAYLGSLENLLSNTAYLQIGGPR